MTRRHPPVPAELARHGIDRLTTTPAHHVVLPGAGQALFHLFKPLLMRRFVVSPPAAPTTEDQAHA